MTPASPSIALVRDLLSDGLRLGAPHTVGGLTLMPVIGGAPGPAYRTVADAIEEGTLTIGELGGGVVPQLVVSNVGALPALLIDGEHLEGAMQDRVLNASVLAAARHDTVIPVSCVERGRWHYEQGRAAGFAPAAEHSYAELRSINAAAVAASARGGRGRSADQRAVWEDVERKRAGLGSDGSPTDALRDAFDRRRSDLERIRRAFVAPGANQTGVLAATAGRVLALDLFDKPATLSAVWDRLVRGYAADALSAEQPTAGNDEAAASGFWKSLTDPDGETTAHEGVGLGIDVIVTQPGVVANALTWEGAVVHLAAFPRGRSDVPGSRGPRARRDRIERPSARARNRHPGRSEERSQDER